jgi:hypothetical protein
MAGFQLLEADSRLLATPNERLSYWIDEFKEHQNLYCAVLRPDGTPVARHPDLSAVRLPPLPPVGPGGRWQGRSTPPKSVGSASSLSGCRSGGKTWSWCLWPPLGR